MSQANQSTVDSYFPVYHKVTKATHILNLNTGEYEKFPDVQKLVFHYMLDRWKFFRSQGGGYFDNQEDIAIACCVVRKTVGKAIKLLAAEQTDPRVAKALIDRYENYAAQEKEVDK